MSDSQSSSIAVVAPPRQTPALTSTLRMKSLGFRVAAADASLGIMDAFAEVFSQMSTITQPLSPKSGPKDDSDAVTTEHQSEEPASASDANSESSDANRDTEPKVDEHLAAFLVENKSANPTSDPSSTSSDVDGNVNAVSTENVDKSTTDSTKNPSNDLQSMKTPDFNSSQGALGDEVALPSDSVQLDGRQKDASGSESAMGQAVVEESVATERKAVESSSGLESVAPVSDEPENALAGSGNESDDAQTGDRRAKRRDRSSHAPNRAAHAESAVVSETSNAPKESAGTPIIENASSMVTPEVAKPETNQTPSASQTSVATQTIDAVSSIASSASSANSGKLAAGFASARSNSVSTIGLSEPSNASRANIADKPKTTPASSSTDLISRAKLIQRVSRAFHHLGAEGGHVRLRLAPAELGTVRLEMRIQSSKVHTRVVAETEAAASALRENLPELRARLQSQGLQVEQLSVEVESEANSDGRTFGGDGFNDRGFEQNRRGPSDPENAKRFRSDRSTETSRNAIESRVSIDASRATQSVDMKL